MKIVKPAKAFTVGKKPAPSKPAKKPEDDPDLPYKVEKLMEKLKAMILSECKAVLQKGIMEMVSAGKDDLKAEMHRLVGDEFDKQVTEAVERCYRNWCEVMVLPRSKTLADIKQALDEGWRLIDSIPAGAKHETGFLFQRWKRKEAPAKKTFKIGKKGAA